MNRKLELPVEILRTDIRLFMVGVRDGFGRGGAIYADDSRGGKDVCFISKH